MKGGYTRRGAIRPPVRWTGYDASLKQYQGEITDKREILDRFRKKVGAASRQAVSRGRTWQEIRLLWEYIKGQANP